MYSSSAGVRDGFRHCTTARPVTTCASGLSTASIVYDAMRGADSAAATARAAALTASANARTKTRGRRPRPSTAVLLAFALLRRAELIVAALAGAEHLLGL